MALQHQYLNDLKLGKEGIDTRENIPLAINIVYSLRNNHAFNDGFNTTVVQVHFIQAIAANPQSNTISVMLFKHDDFFRYYNL